MQLQFGLSQAYFAKNKERLSQLKLSKSQNRLAPKYIYISCLMLVYFANSSQPAPWARSNFKHPIYTLFLYLLTKCLLRIEP